MKKLTRYLSIGLLSLSVIGAQADDSGDKHEQHAQKRFAHMVERLDLDQEQIDHINAVKESQQEQRLALEADKKALRVQAQALQADFRQQLEGVLSEEQLDKFDAMNERRQRKMEHRKGGMKPHSRS